MANQSIRSIARETGYTTAQIRDTCRDLQIPMDYQPSAGWSLSEPVHADMLTEMLNEQD